MGTSALCGFTSTDMMKARRFALAVNIKDLISSVCNISTLILSSWMVVSRILISSSEISSCFHCSCLCKSIKVASLSSLLVTVQ